MRVLRRPRPIRGRRTVARTRVRAGVEHADAGIGVAPRGGARHVPEAGQRGLVVQQLQAQEPHEHAALEREIVRLPDLGLGVGLEQAEQSVALRQERAGVRHACRFTSGRAAARTAAAPARGVERRCGALERADDRRIEVRVLHKRAPQVLGGAQPVRVVG